MYNIQGTMEVKVTSVGFKKVRYRVIHYLPDTAFKRPVMELIRINHIVRIIIIHREIMIVNFISPRKFFQHDVGGVTLQY